MERADDLLVLVADSALMAGSTDHEEIRQAAQQHHDLIQAAIEAAEDAVDAFERAYSPVNRFGLDTGDLLDLFDDEHRGTFAALTAWTRQAQSALDQAESVGTLTPAHSRAIVGRKYNPWAAFFHDFSTRLKRAYKVRQMTGGFRLRDSEVAGLTAAAIDWKDTSPISRTSETNDSRTEKIRTARTSEVGK